MTPVANYDEIAAGFGQRYVNESYPGLRACLARWTRALPTPRVLELGCGTGHWLTILRELGCDVAGIDPSAEMLARAEVRGDLRQGSAEALPWHDETFGGVLAVNALHHFREPEQALREAHRVLARGGHFLSVGLDPHAYEGAWYVYEFFPATLDHDRARFADFPTREAWLHAAGFVDVRVECAERFQKSHSHREALFAGALARTFTSQLSVLSDTEYARGIQRIEATARDSDAPFLQVDLKLDATFAQKR